MVKKPRRSPRTTAPLDESSIQSSSFKAFLLSPSSLKPRAEKILLSRSVPERVLPEKIRNSEPTATAMAIKGVYILNAETVKYRLIKK